MQIVRLADPGQPPSLIPDTAPQPEPGPGEVLIRVRAAGVIPTELSWYPTSHRKTGETRTRAVPGHEFSGVIAASGEDADTLKAGSEVYGMNDWFADGAMAEYCVAPVSAVAPKPVRLTHAETASVPISALTAWQGLYDRAKLQAGERVLVHGGAGGVGTFAIQLARLRGAHVVATASSKCRDFVLSLGAAEVIDYHQARFEQIVKDLDVVFDTVGGETLERSWQTLKPGGRMVTVASTAEASYDERVKRAFFIVEPNRNQLVEIAGLLDEGKLQVVVDSVYPLSRAPEVFAGKAPRQGRGKVVIEVPDEVLKKN